MNGFSADGIDGVGNNYSSFVPSRRVAKNSYKTDGYMRGLIVRATVIRIQNLHSLNVCAPHKD
jgi:hypothetical protein